MSENDQLRTFVRYTIPRLMERHRTRSWIKAVAAACGLSSLAACSDMFMETRQDSPQEYVVLTITDHTGGTIDGTWGETDSVERKVLGELSLPSADVMADSVFFCGPAFITIDRSWLHAQIVSFPSGSGEGKSDLEVVRCVQAHVGFSFSAGIGPALEPGEISELDYAPFISLQSKKKPPRP